MATVPTDPPLAAAGADGVARAALLGIAGGMRTTVPLATLAARGRIARTGPGRYLIFAATAAELVGDKSPAAADRTGAVGLPGRLATSAFAGRSLGGWPGLAAGLLGAGIGTFTSFRLRAQGSDVLPLAEPVVAALEDAVALGLGALATAGLEERPAPEAEVEMPEQERPSVLTSVARGIAAGAIGTVAMTAGQLAYYQLTGGELSDEPARAGNKVLKAVFGTQVKRRHSTAFTWIMHGAYGTGWGAAYGLAAGGAGARRPELAATGAAFGLGVWGASLVELPALGEAPPPWQQPLGGLAVDAGFHLLYGLSTAAAYRALGRGRGRAGAR